MYTFCAYFGVCLIIIIIIIIIKVTKVQVFAASSKIKQMRLVEQLAVWHVLLLKADFQCKRLDRLKRVDVLGKDSKQELCVQDGVSLVICRGCRAGPLVELSV